MKGTNMQKRFGGILTDWSFTTVSGNSNLMEEYYSEIMIPPTILEGKLITGQHIRSTYIVDHQRNVVETLNSVYELTNWEDDPEEVVE